jgi:general secretion pathway protein H
MHLTHLAPHPSSQQGFTLLELLVTLVIIAVLAGLVVPDLNHNSGRDTNEAAERLAMMINHAQQESVLTSQIWQVVFDPAAGSYEFRRRSGNGFEPVTAEPYTGTFATPGVSMQGLRINGETVTGKGEVYLFPTGEHDPFQVVLQSDERAYLIAMDPVGPAWLEPR